MPKEPAWRARAESIPPGPASVPGLIWQTLFSRGLRSDKEIESFLSPSLKSLRSPFLLKNMNLAVERMVHAFRRGERVCVYADFDLDGTSGLALLKTGLELLGYKNVLGYQPQRLAEGYGVHIPAVEEIARAGTQVLITVDVGITAAEALGHAMRLGMDVILTDHHLPHGDLPQVHALINPNQGDCESRLGHLAGVGVAFYFLLAVRAGLRDAGLGRTDFDPKDLLDFFVIGTLTDMVPLKEENRVLSKFGLHQLAKTKRPGLRSLLDVLDLSDRELSSQDVAIRFAPKLNALSRLESQIRPIDMFLVDDEREARARAQEVVACNQRRVKIQREAEAVAREQVKGFPGDNFVFVWSREFHRGVVGLVATRLAEEFQVPALVGAADEQGRIVGSARLPKRLAGASLVESLGRVKDYLERFGGHAQAAGFELKAEQAEALRESLKNAFTSSVETVQSPELTYDAVGELVEIGPELMRWQESLAPFGVDFEAPQYRLRGGRIRRATELKGGHLRLDLEVLGARSRVGAIWFSPPEEAVKLAVGAGDGPYEFLGEPVWNYFQGQKSLQLQLKGIRPQVL